MLTRVLQRVVVAPATIALTVAMWVGLPLWLLGAGVVSGETIHVEGGARHA